MQHIQQDIDPVLAHQLYSNCYNPVCSAETDMFSRAALQRCWLCRAVPHTLVLEHVSPATRLLEKRRQMFEVQEALEQQKMEFNRKV